MTTGPISRAPLLLAGVGIALALPTPAFAQDQRRQVDSRSDCAAAPTRPKTRLRKPTAATSSSPPAAAPRTLQDVPIAVTAYSGEQLERAGRARHHRHRRHHAQRHARNLARHQLDPDRLHPRRRPAGSGRRLRSGRRHLSRRRLSQPPAGRGARHLRRRADRGAARAAGHALRPQHDRRRDQICHPPPARRARAAASAATLGTYDQADLVVSGEHAGRRRRCASAASVARLTPRRLRQEPHHRRRQLQQGRLGRPRHGRGRPRATTSSSASPGDYTKDNSNPRGGHRLIPGLLSRRAGARRRVRHPRRARSIPSRRSRPTAASLSRRDRARPTR